MISVLIADDNAAFRFGLRTMLSALPDIEVVAEAASGDEAVVHTARQHPDVVVMDLTMATHDDGMTATERIAEQAPHVGVLVLTMSAQDSALSRALQSGARGYLVKGAPRQEIERAVRTVAAGGLVVGAALAHRPGSMVGSRAQPVGLARLSGREREVLALMAEGSDNPTIARRLVLSQKTVRNLVSGVFAKLGASDRAHAVRLAREQGLPPADPGAPSGPTTG